MNQLLSLPPIPTVIMKYMNPKMEMIITDPEDADAARNTGTAGAVCASQGWKNLGF